MKIYYIKGNGKDSKCYDVLQECKYNNVANAFVFLTISRIFVAGATGYGVNKFCECIGVISEGTTDRVFNSIADMGGGFIRNGLEIFRIVR